MRENETEAEPAIRSMTIAMNIERMTKTRSQYRMPAVTKGIQTVSKDQPLSSRQDTLVRLSAVHSLLKMRNRKESSDTSLRSHVAVGANARMAS